MRHWSVKDAKARFSEMLEACATEGAQIVTRCGIKAAVLVPIDEWVRLNARSRPTLKQLLQQDDGRGDLRVPPRGRLRRRASETI